MEAVLNLIAEMNRIVYAAGIPFVVIGLAIFVIWWRLEALAKNAEIIKRRQVAQRRKASLSYLSRTENMLQQSTEYVYSNGAKVRIHHGRFVIIENGMPTVSYKQQELVRAQGLDKSVYVRALELVCHVYGLDFEREHAYMQTTALARRALKSSRA